MCSCRRVFCLQVRRVFIWLRLKINSTSSDIWWKTADLTSIKRLINYIKTDRSTDRSLHVILIGGSLDDCPPMHPSSRCYTHLGVLTYLCVLTYLGVLIYLQTFSLSSLFSPIYVFSSVFFSPILLCFHPVFLFYLCICFGQCLSFVTLCAHLTVVIFAHSS